MLVPLILCSKGVLSRPTFYISAYLEQHWDENNARLLAVSRDRDWNGWVAFFLNALVEQVADNTQKAKTILDLYNERKNSVSEVTRSPYAIQAIDAIFSRPIFKRTDFIAESHIPRQSAHRILQNLQKNGILTEIQEGRGKLAAIYSFPRVYSISHKDRFNNPRAVISCVTFVAH